MTTPEKPQIRNVLATNARNGQMCVSQPIELVIHDRICGVYRRHRPKAFQTERTTVTRKSYGWHVSIANV
jgi:hypothetical protein